MFDDLLAANRHFSEGFALAGIPAPAAKEFALVTCMDTRIEPLSALGLVPGDAKIMRNAGARVTPDVLRSLTLAVQYLGVRRIAVMHHTRCAMASLTEAQIRDDLASAGREADPGWEFLTMPDPDLALRGDVALVRECALIPSDVAVEGWRYDVDTGGIDRIVTG